MAKKVEVKILPNGKIEATTLGVKGKSCLEYIAILEQLLEAKTSESKFTDEYYMTETQTDIMQDQTINLEQKQ